MIFGDEKKKHFFFVRENVTAFRSCCSTAANGASGATKTFAFLAVKGNAAPFFLPGLSCAAVGISERRGRPGRQMAFPRRISCSKWSCWVLSDLLTPLDPVTPSPCPPLPSPLPNFSPPLPSRPPFPHLPPKSLLQVSDDWLRLLPAHPPGLFTVDLLPCVVFDHARLCSFRKQLGLALKTTRSCRNNVTVVS